MTSSFTPNKNLELQVTGENVDQWGNRLNANVISILDSILGATLSLTLASTSIILSTSQSQNLNYALTGALTADVTITYPAVGGFFNVINATTGAHIVTFASAGAGTSIVVPQGTTVALFSDGTNIRTPAALTLADPAAAADAVKPYLLSSLLPSGAVSSFAMSTAPDGWLECDGSLISRTVYAALFAAIGTTFGAGDGTTTFGIPDLRGQFVRGWDDGRGVDPGRAFGTRQTDAFQGHGWKVVTKDIALGSGTNPIPNASGSDQNGTVDGPFSDGTHGTPRVASETRPTNVALLWCIKT